MTTPSTASCRICSKRRTERGHGRIQIHHGAGQFAANLDAAKLPAERAAEARLAVARSLARLLDWRAAAVERLVADSAGAWRCGPYDREGDHSRAVAHGTYRPCSSSPSPVSNATFSYGAPSCTAGTTERPTCVPAYNTPSGSRVKGDEEEGADREAGAAAIAPQPVAACPRRPERHQRGRAAAARRARRAGR